MNHIAEEMLMHYGIPRRSGRYPWGSGEDPYQRNRDFLGRVDEFRSSGFTFTDEYGKLWRGDTAIAKSMGLSTTEFRTELALAQQERRMLDVARAKSLRADGKGYTEIGREMGINESSVRSLLDDKAEARTLKAQQTADFLKSRVEECIADGGMIDVGAGAERELNISREKLNQALYLLKREGYEVYGGRFSQIANPNQKTTQLVLCPPGTEHKEIYDLSRIHTLKEYISRDGGETFEKKFHYPESMDSSRLQIRYKEDGGIDRDGIVEIRRGVEDLSLGESQYSQVRILVDGTHYIKGVAVYSDAKDWPPGVDVVFNTNKSQGTPMTKVLKEIKKDPDNPFGSAIKDGITELGSTKPSEQGGQYWYTDKNGNKKLGLINKRADEGDWSEWKDALPSQFLAKQSKNMAQKQLDLAKADKLAQFEEYCSITNPTIKRHMLAKFADECDSSAVNLKAAALPGQKYHVIIPINTLKDDEVYAPRYEDGTKLALVRFPHGGTFEIPILTVNNKNALGDEIITKHSSDAIGITSKVAERLSGADFDGDTVMCIPTHDKYGKVKISSRDKLKGLEGFDPKDAYSADEVKVDADGTEHYYRNGHEYRRMTKHGTQHQMGVISNLITDMTLAGANDDELAAAVRHSMVVIDAEKHKLDYKQSEVDNNISALHTKYQGKARGGAATILSKAKGEKTVDKRQGSPKINIEFDPKTGKRNDWYDPSKPEGSLIWKTAKDLEYTVPKVNKRTGEVTMVTKKRTQMTTKMADADDAYELLSDARHPMELIYADYANSMKSLANKARVEMMNTGSLQRNKAAAETYKDEVASLDTKLHTALLNTTRERAAQRMATAEVQAKKQSGVIDDNGDAKKAGARALSKYRAEVGSVTRKDRNILITDREWEAIQAGAISDSKLKQILNNADVDDLRQRATPRNTNSVRPAQANRIKSLSNSNYTLDQIAAIVGVSPTTVSNVLRGKE